MAKRWKQHCCALLLAMTAIVSTALPSFAAELVMFESSDCPWCDAWHAEIGPIYPKTSEGKAAPLRTVDIHGQRPDDLDHVEGVRYTPTFVLIDDDGREVGRINGYPGEDFFWGMLGELIEKLPPKLKPLTST